MNKKDLIEGKKDIVSLLLTELMDHVDDSFPRTNMRNEDGVLSLAAFEQHSWARSQEWLDCLEELVVHMSAPIFNSHHYYYIGREFKE